jgi:hypothetical protein
MMQQDWIEAGLEPHTGGSCPRLDGFLDMQGAVPLWVYICNICLPLGRLGWWGGVRGAGTSAV